jgi:cysteine synthase A
MAATTSPEKIALIERTGGTCHLVADPTTVYAVAQQLAKDADGTYLDQFTNADRATDWRGNNNIAESIFDQLAHEPHPLPHWVVVGAGTGGTSATIGRFIRYQANATTQLCVVDPEGSAFHPAWSGSEPGELHGSRIEGIGRPRVEPSFRPDVIDAMIRVPDAGSVAAMQMLRVRAGIQAGPSTGTNIYGVLKLACEMAARGQSGSIVSLVCDRSDRYEATHCSPAWLTEHDLDPEPYAAPLASAWDTATWPPD